ncbi:MAG: HopJ type III effector protein [Cellvibrionales bacterium]|nr:HopJ type III effector protein [Cellvibrionales bacterium]
MAIEKLIQQINNDPDSTDFKEVIATIEANYAFTPTAFKNGLVNNSADKNQGSCKIFAFAKLNGLTKEQTLPLFGQYYFDEVLKHPDTDNHNNIRQFMKTGWGGITFDGIPLVKT